MTKEELIELCQNIIDESQEQLQQKPATYEFYNSFVRTHNLKTMSGIAKIPYLDFATALFYADSLDNDLTFSEVIDDIDSFRNVINELSGNELDQLNQIFSNFLRVKDGKILEIIFNNDDKEMMLIKTKKLFSSEKDTKQSKEFLDIAYKLMEKLIINNKKPGWNVSKLLEYYISSPHGTFNIISVIDVMKKINEDGLDYKSKKFEDRYDYNNILKMCNGIDLCRKMLNDKYKKRESCLSSKINIYKRFIRNVNAAFEKEEITNYETIIRDIDDEEIKVEFLRLVYEHNRPFYDRVEEKNEKLTKNSLVNYLSVLKNNGIKKDEVDLNKIMKNSCEDLDRMIKILIGIVPDRNVVLRIIEYTDLINVNYFKELKANNVLNSNAFIRYPLIFDSNSSYRKVLDENIKIINDYGLDFTLFTKNSQVLIENNNLNSSLSILNSYMLLNNLKDTRKFNFLNDDKLFEKLDKIIELGYEKYLDAGLDLLNENNWDRIYVLKSMGMLPERKEELLKCLREDKFFIPDEKLNLYIEDNSKYSSDLDVSYEIDMTRIIRENTITSNSLCFDGVIISKNRVARNLISEEFDTNDLFRAVINGSILSMEEIESIKSVFKNKVYKLDY